MEDPVPAEGCPNCLLLQARVAELRQQVEALSAVAEQLTEQAEQITALAAEVRELEARLNRNGNSSNSSRPPSSDPPWAPKQARHKPSGRKRGGQRGHPGKQRQVLAAEEVDERHEYRPRQCEQCEAPLPADLPLEEKAWVHQVFELPEVRPHVSEHVRWACRCPQCGRKNWAPLPPGVSPSGYGPRAHATTAWLTGKGRLSRRNARECLRELFRLPVALGTVSKLEKRVSTALAGAYAEVRDAVQAEPVLHADETRWREGASHPWLWVLASSCYCLLTLTDRRNREALRGMLGASGGEDAGRTLISDRYGVYGDRKPEQRQYCWAHLDRDFLAVSQSQDPLAFLGAYCLEEVDTLFAGWHRFREGRLTRAELAAKMAPVQKRLRTWLSWGEAAGGKKLAGFFGNLLVNWESLWVFLRVEGVEPTNNRAERLLRPAVLWRKTSYGTQSETGRRYAERMLTVSGTLGLQGRSVFAFLMGCCEAAVNAIAPPTLLVEPGSTAPLALPP